MHLGINVKVQVIAEVARRLFSRKEKLFYMLSVIIASTKNENKTTQ